MYFRRFTWLIVFLLLAGCQSGELPPLPTPELWQVRVTPALAWLGADLNACTRQFPGAGLLLSETPAGQEELAAGEISLRWGAPPALPAFASILGWDELVLIVHPDNPLRSLAPQQARAIYAAELRAWAEIDPQLEELGEIQVWTYPENEESRQIFEDVLRTGPSHNPFAWLAPSPAAMREAVSQDPAAIGFLPGRWLDENVKDIHLEEKGIGSLYQPILALSADQPTPDQTQWLVCLQESLKR